MNHNVEVTVEEVRDAVPSRALREPSVVLETESLVDGQRRDTSIEVREQDAPTVAAALLNVEAPFMGVGAGLPMALQCLGVGLVHGASPGQVRLHLQFDSGQVLPIEMSRDAAAALSRALVEQIGVRR